MCWGITEIEWYPNNFINTIWKINIPSDDLCPYCILDRDDKQESVSEPVSLSRSCTVNQ
jgi:hypothetical protein